MDAQPASRPERAQRVCELRRLVQTGIYAVDADRLARAIISRSRRIAGKQLDGSRPD
jgi:anti-sigma28 factor (negative regulator of flagellin synthesis)